MEGADHFEGSPSRPTQQLPGSLSPLAKRVHTHATAGGGEDHQNAGNSHRDGTKPMMPTSMPVAGGVQVTAIHDAHARLLNFFQHSEGIGALLEAMDKCGVSECALMGRPLKKTWSEVEERRPESPWGDTSPLYYFSLTDMYVHEAVRQLGPGGAARRFKPLLCGFNPTDKSAGEHINSLFDHYPNVWRGIGEVIFRNGDVSPLCPRPLATPACSAFHVVLKTAASRKVPVVLSQDATSGHPKPYSKSPYEYTGELFTGVAKHPTVKVLWCGAGIHQGLQRATGYVAHVSSALRKYPNLFISVTAGVLRGHPELHGDLAALCEEQRDQVMVGSSTEGRFTAEYEADMQVIRGWGQRLSPETEARVFHETARKFYAEMPTLSGQVHLPNPTAMVASSEGWGQGGNSVASMLEDMYLGVTEEARPLTQAEAEALDRAPPLPEHVSLEGMRGGKLTHGNGDPSGGSESIPHVSIDTNMHWFDMQQKSCGARAIQRAMDGIGVRKAVMLGMPLCKKWARGEPERPFDALDDMLGPCYYYAFSDQMVADAWLALDNGQRARFAPVMGGFNPTDMNAVDHLERLWDKYPGMWRGVGKIVCRNSTLGPLLGQQDEDVAVVNHPALRRVFGFCVAHGLVCMVNQDAERPGNSMGDGRWEYVYELEQVLHDFPTLKLVWCHAGVSSQSNSEGGYPEMLDMMLSKYPKLMCDLSGDMWEREVCTDAGAVRREWVALFEKHSTRFTVGSDLLGQYLGPMNNNWLRPEMQKYWALADQLTTTTVRALLYENAERVWFQNWEIPIDKKGKLQRIEPSLRAETFHPHQGEFKRNPSSDPMQQHEVF